jgi:glycosyltransferase involved in cell wall biosynthesis
VDFRSADKNMRDSENTTRPGTPARPLRIIHVLRAPLGGLFRHVVDLVRGQVARGHQVGIVADSTTGGARTDDIFATLRPDLALGLMRLPMSRHLGPSDFGACREVARRVAASAADIVHGHGAKGGAYARLASHGAIRVYTPHGGSLHFEWSNLVGVAYLTLERVLLRRTDLILFESAYASQVFVAKIGRTDAVMRVVHNGVAETEFQPVAPDAMATDIVFVGELRTIKGVDVLLEAVSLLARNGRRLTVTIVGAGPEAAALAARTTALGLRDAVHFPGAMPARRAFALGRLLVIPSRFESLPYIVLEAVAAAMPLVTTAVGGNPEIYGPLAGELVAPGDPAVLAQAIATALDNSGDRQATAQRLQARVRKHFSVDAMVDAVLDGYRTAVAQRA